MTRKSKQFSSNKVIHIYTEGETEEKYFKGLRSTAEFRAAKSLKVMPFCEGLQGLPLMAHVKRKVKQVKNEEKPDEVYTIFDKDELSNEEVQKCINDYPEFHIGFSNRSFELWLALHFQEVKVAKSQKQLEDIVSEGLGKTYKKVNDEQLKVIIEHLEQAHQNAVVFGELGKQSVKMNPYTNLSCVIQEMLG
ncbi:MAG: RloB family protein [Streptococcaceae bacterium]|nr:RloB family protein [Streptococcaceae bacterium]